MKVILNGNVIDEKEVNAGINNRAFNYGDGIFETMIGDDNIRYIDDHLQRLLSGLKALKIEVPSDFTIKGLSDFIKMLRAENNISGLSRIKLIVWRRTGGLFSPIHNEAEFLITIVPFEYNHKQVKTKAVFYEEIKTCFSPISKFKKISSLTYVLAGIYKNETASDEVILFDTDNNVSETISSNIFWIKNDIVFTPSLDTGCIEGIMRKQILKLLTENKINYKEGKFQREELLNADCTFTSNVAGLIPMKDINGKDFAITHPTLEKIKGQLF